MGLYARQMGRPISHSVHVFKQMWIGRVDLPSANAMYERGHFEHTSTNGLFDWSETGIPDVHAAQRLSAGDDAGRNALRIGIEELLQESDR
jgi:hypothetical protein